MVILYTQFKVLALKMVLQDRITAFSQISHQRNREVSNLHKCTPLTSEMKTKYNVKIHALPTIHVMKPTFPGFSYWAAGLQPNQATVHMRREEWTARRCQESTQQLF